MLFSACAVKAQTETTHKVHLWSRDGKHDQPFINNLWVKLKNSTIKNDIGVNSFIYEWNGIKEGDYIVLIDIYSYVGDEGKFINLSLFQYAYVDQKKELLYKDNMWLSYLNKDESVIDFIYKQSQQYILDWHKEYFK
jgi:hypothetical protein